MLIASPQADAIGVTPWVWLSAIRDGKLTREEKALAWVLASHADEYGRVSALNRRSAFSYWVANGAGIRGASTLRHTLAVKGYVREVAGGGVQLAVPIID